MLDEMSRKNMVSCFYSNCVVVDRGYTIFKISNCVVAETGYKIFRIYTTVWFLWKQVKIFFEGKD